MNEQDWYKAELFAALAASDGTLITASKRQARVWTEQYHQHAEQIEKVWTMPDILPIGAWFSRTYEVIAQNYDVPLLLNKIQSLNLWESIIRRSEVTDYLISVSATAKKVQETFQLLEDWRVPISSIIPEVLDHELFLTWAQEYQAQLTRNRWIDASQLPAWLESRIDQAVTENQLGTTESLLNAYSVNLKLLGFHQISTAQRSLLARYCELSGGTLQWLAPRPLDSQQTSGVEFKIAQDFEHEVRSAAEWALAKVHSDKLQYSGKDSQRYRERRVAIVIPGLEQRRYEVENILRSQLHPECLTAGFPSEKLYNLSVGTALREYPVVRVALSLIKLMHQAISQTELVEVMTCDSLGLWRELLTEQQHQTLKRLAFHLPEAGEQRLSLAQLVQLISLEFRQDEIKQDVFIELLESEKAVTDKDTFDGWARTFIGWLDLWGWFRGQTLSSYDYQLREQFIQIIHSLRQFNTLYESVRFEQVYKLLNQIIDTEVFQAKSLGEPIAVMGLYEAIGLEFDAVWITGLSNEVLPEPPQSSPFIPLAIAQEYDLPGSSPERELLYAKQLLKQLRGISHQFVISYFQYDGDRHLNSSPLLTTFQMTPNLDDALVSQARPAAVKWCELPNVLNEIDLPSLELENFNDEAGLPYTDRQLTSGNQFLTAQSKCPMQGYLEFRVNLCEQASPVKGIDPRDRGVFVHQVMQALWQKLKSHSTLIGTPDAQLKQLIHESLRKNSDSNINRHSLLADLEHARYFELIYQLLQQEKQREPFTVEHLEYEQTIELNGLSVKTRLDRIDREEESRARVLLDYKTGRVSSNPWFNDRLGEPQLPLYLQSDPTNIKALCFAQLHHEEVKFVGVSESDKQLPKVKSIEKSKEFEDWTSFVDHLDQKLVELADEIKSGVASVTPEQKLKACDYCPFDAVCRVGELHGIDDLTEELD